MPSVAAASRLLGRLHRKEVGKDMAFYHAFDLAYHEVKLLCLAVCFLGMLVKTLRPIALMAPRPHGGDKDFS